jgi:hypothetical protein
MLQSIIWDEEISLTEEEMDDLEYRMQEEERECNPERYYSVSGWF